jgi:hypothetical protein
MASFEKSFEKITVLCFEKVNYFAENNLFLKQK